MKVRLRVDPVPYERQKRQRREEEPVISEGAKAYFVTILPFLAVIAALGMGLFALVNWLVLNR